MAYQFYNIGKANSRIAELETELAAAKTAAPDQQLQARIEEALASNEETSTQLSAVTAENIKLTTSVTELTNAKNSLGSELTAVTSALTLACTQMNVGNDEEIAKLSNAEKVAKLQSAASAAVAKTGVDISQIPSGTPAKTGEAKKITRAEFDAMSFASRNEFIRTGGKIKD